MELTEEQKSRLSKLQRKVYWMNHNTDPNDYVTAGEVSCCLEELIEIFVEDNYRAP